MNQVLQKRRTHVDKVRADLILAKGCEQLSARQSGLYCKPIDEIERSLKLMRIIDEQHLKSPWYGTPQMNK